jgi:hypothetical protein
LAFAGVMGAPSLSQNVAYHNSYGCRDGESITNH